MSTRRGIRSTTSSANAAAYSNCPLARTCATGCIRNVYVSTYVQYFQRGRRVWWSSASLCSLKINVDTACAAHTQLESNRVRVFAAALMSVFCLPHLYYFPRARASGSISTAALLKKHFSPGAPSPRHREILIGILFEFIVSLGQD